MSLPPAHRNDVIYSQAVAQAWTDSAYKQALLKDPDKVLRQAGMEIPDGLKLTAVEDTATLTHVVLPPGADASQLDSHIRQLKAEGQQVKVLQNTAQHAYVPLPAPPPGFLGDANAAARTVSGALGGPLASLTGSVLHDINVSVSVSMMVVAAAVAVSTASLSA